MYVRKRKWIPPLSRNPGISHWTGVTMTLTSSRAYVFLFGGSECGRSVGDGGCIRTRGATGGGGGAARGERRATGDNLRGGSGEFARIKFVICVRSGLRRGASTLKRKQ